MSLFSENVKENIQNRHDKIFKEAYLQPQIAVEFLREFLPKSLKSKIDLTSIELLDSKFISLKQIAKASNLSEQKILHILSSNGRGK